MTEHRFGGHWTEEKLLRIRKYLDAYMQIFSKNPKARFLRTIYVDAFAGTGYRNPDKRDQLTLPLYEDNDVNQFQKGSAIYALETRPPFDEYVFVEHSPDHYLELENMISTFAEKNIITSIVRKDANEFLQKWCADTDWRRNRAVVFLDPYGMEVEWETLEAIAKTKAIDLWILFPLGQAVNRLLTRGKIPEGPLAERLNRFFGTDGWKKAFYRKKQQMEWYNTEESYEKSANLDSIGSYFINRLKIIFEKVAEKPLPLYNSKNVPIFLLCFCASNPKGAKTAVNIAQHILRN